MSKTVLIVEDDPDIRMNLEELLDSEGYHVYVAENGQVALDVLASKNPLPNLIILDLTMPVMDWFQFRERQLADSRFKEIPIAIMTADGHVDDKRLRTKAAAGLHKPADIYAILEMVNRLAC